MNLLSRFPQRLMSACAVAAAAAVCTPALAEPIFTSNEGSVPGSLPNLVTADRISFNYQGTIVQTVNGGAIDGDDPFREDGFLTKASFANGGQAVQSQLNGLEASGGYGIYGLFTITGTSTGFSSPSGPGIQANFQTATVNLFIDPNQDTTFSQSTPGTAFNTGNSGEDYLIATLNLITGTARVFGGLANGDFDSLLSLTLTPAGQAFFVSPNPFFNLENFGGNTQTLTGASLTQSFVATATGAGTELFVSVVPEPTSVSLVGLALLGMGAAARRRNKQA